MIGRLNHVAIVVPDLDVAAARYRDDLGARVEAPFELPEHGVRVVMVRLDNTTVELLHPLSDASPVAGFLKKKLRQVPQTIQRFLRFPRFRQGKQLRRHGGGFWNSSTRRPHEFLQWSRDVLKPLHSESRVE